MKNVLAIVKKGIGTFIGGLLLVIGGGIGLENVQAPGSINIPIMIFSLSASLVGSIILFLSIRKNKN